MVKMGFRNSISQLLPHRFKNSVKHLLGRPRTRLNDSWSILAPIGPVYSDHVILDIGAHHGWFFHCWQDWCPQARIIAFEPYPESFQTMYRLYGADPRVKLVQAGVGAEVGVAKLNVLTGSKVSNSFLKPQEQAWSEIAYEHGEIEKVAVPVTTVNEVFRQEGLSRVYLFKIDVQGYEIEVLKGAEQSLSKIDHIFVESGIKRLYEGAPCFTDVFEFLASHGFHLMAMRSWHRGNGVLIETDMLFRRNDLAGPVDSSIDRIYQKNG